MRRKIFGVLTVLLSLIIHSSNLVASTLDSVQPPMLLDVSESGEYEVYLVKQGKSSVENPSVQPVEIHVLWKPYGPNGIVENYFTYRSLTELQGIQISIVDREEILFDGLRVVANLSQRNERRRTFDGNLIDSHPSLPIDLKQTQEGAFYLEHAENPLIRSKILDFQSCTFPLGACQGPVFSTQVRFDSRGNVEGYHPGIERDFVVSIDLIPTLEYPYSMGLITFSPVN